MPKFDYAEMRALAEELIDDFGFAATLTKRTRTGGTRVNPGAVTATETPVVIVDKDVRKQLATDTPQGGLALTETQRIVTISTSAGVAPEPGDTLTFGNNAYSISKADPYAPGGVVLFYTATIDGSE